MSYRINLKVTTTCTSSKSNNNNGDGDNITDLGNKDIRVLDTLEQIAQLPIKNDNDDGNDDDDPMMTKCNEVKRKQDMLSSIVKSIQQQKRNNEQSQDAQRTGSTILLPLSAITMARQIVLESQQLKISSSSSLLTILEYNLKHNNNLQLHFSSSSTTTNNNNNKNSIQYQKRIQQLKLNMEERNYTKLTSNINSSSNSSDDANVKSMLYASSVGLNMIVAPISIGVLMYFFAGKLFIWLFGNDSVDDSNQSLLYHNKNHKLNIHGVIVGVISGVIMLFIEMILFVIRNHEMDKHLISKKKKRRKNPFGYDKKTAERTFHG